MSGVVKERCRTKKQIIDPALYRIPMQITEIHIHWDGNGYYVCPRCQMTLERDFSSYCDRCGQCLNWKGYRKAKRIYIHWDGTRKQF